MIFHYFGIIQDMLLPSLPIIPTPKGEVWSSCFGRYPTFGSNTHVWSW